MSNSIQAVHTAATHAPAGPVAQPAAKAAKSAPPQDTVKISTAAQQAFAKISSSHDVDHDGDKH